MRIDFETMTIEYEDYTGTPKFTDFVSMVWDKIVITRNVWRWKFYSNRTGDIWRKIEGASKLMYTGSPLPIIKEPANFNPSSAESFFDVYDVLIGEIAIQERKENQRFRRLMSANKKRGENLSKSIREYIEDVTGERYNNEKHKTIFNTLRQLTK